MRIARLCGVLLAVLTTGLLLAPPAGAQPPLRLPGYVTDNAGAAVRLRSGHGDIGHRQALRRSPHPAVGGLRRRLLRAERRELGDSAPTRPATWATTTRCWPCPAPGAPMPSWFPTTVRSIKPESGRRPAPQPDRTRVAQRRLERRGGCRGQRAQQATRLHRSDRAAGGFGRRRRRRRGLAHCDAPPRPATACRRLGRGAAGRPDRRECAGRCSAAGP